jgi:hypothetical protein
VAIFQHEHDANAYLLSKLDDGPKWTKKTCAINLNGLMNALLKKEKEVMLFLYTNIHCKNSDGTETEETLKTTWPEKCQRDMHDSLCLSNICTMKSLMEYLCKKDQVAFRNLTVVNLGVKLIGNFELFYSNTQLVITVSSTIKDF